MALQQDYTDLATGLTVQNAYWRCDTLNTDDRTPAAAIILGVYPSKADSDAGRRPFAQHPLAVPSEVVAALMVKAPDPALSLRDNLKRESYLYLKTLPEFADATDA